MIELKTEPAEINLTVEILRKGKDVPETFNLVGFLNFIPSDTTRIFSETENGSNALNSR